VIFFQQYFSTKYRRKGTVQTVFATVNGRKIKTGAQKEVPVRPI
jgi:hypothetical protein